MIKALIIDDEPLARSLVREYLSAFSEIRVLQECNDGFEGVKAIAQHQPDLLFLDIQMPKISGFEMLELIENPPAVIFTTAFDEYAIKAFEAHAVDYLLKPFSKDRFEIAIHKWLKQRVSHDAPNKELIENRTPQPEEQTRVVVKKGANIIIIPVGQIHYLEAYDDYVKIHTHQGIHLKKKTMAHFEGVLDSKQFVRVHRSYLLNLGELTRIEPMDKDNHVALLKNGAQIPLSQSGYGKLKSVLGI
jgi:two-component system, LytTR family, response regulator